MGRPGTVANPGIDAIRAVAASIPKSEPDQNTKCRTRCFRSGSQVFSVAQRATRSRRHHTGDGELALVAAAAALGLAALGAVLFLNADEAQTATVLANNA